MRKKKIKISWGQVTRSRRVTRILRGAPAWSAHLQATETKGQKGRLRPAEAPPPARRPARASSGSRKQKQSLLAPGSDLGGLGGSAGWGRRWRKRSEWAFPGRRRRQAWAPAGDSERLRPPSGPERRSSLCRLARTDQAGASEEGGRDGPGPSPAPQPP